MPPWLFSVFGPDRVSRRTPERKHQSWFLRFLILNRLRASQVISARDGFSPKWNTLFGDEIMSVVLLLYAEQTGLVITPAEAGSVFPRVQSWTAPLLPLSAGISPVWACCRPCWVRWSRIWTHWALIQHQHLHRVPKSTEHKALLDFLWPWSLHWDVWCTSLKRYCRISKKVLSHKLVEIIIQTKDNPCRLYSHKQKIRAWYHCHCIF